MNLSRTKLIIGIAVLALILGTAGLYWYWRPSAPESAVPAGQVGVSGRTAPFSGSSRGIGKVLPQDIGSATSAPVSFPVADNPAQILTRITDFPVVSPSLDKEGKRVVFYKKNGGDLLSADFDGGRMEKLSNLTIVGLLGATWSPARDRAAVRYRDADTIKTFLQIGTSSVAVLPADITSIAWSPDGKSLAYTRVENGALALAIGDQAGKNPRIVFTTPIRDARIAWPSLDRITFTTPASGFAEGYAFSYSRATRSFEKIFGPAYGLQALWSPFGAQALFAYTPRGGDRIILASYDISGRKQTKITPETLTGKCVWTAAAEVWCAVPRALSGAGPLPDTYLSGEYNSSDRIVRLDPIKNTAEEIFNEGEFDMSDLLIAAEKNYLFFIDRNDGTLWSLKLQ